MVNHPWAMIMRNLRHSVQLVRVLVESLLQQRDSFMQRFQRLYWNDMSNHPWAMIMHNLEHSVQLVRVLVELLLQQRDSFMQRFHLFTAQRFFSCSDFTSSWPMAMHQGWQRTVCTEHEQVFKYPEQAFRASKQMSRYLVPGI